MQIVPGVEFDHNTILITLKKTTHDTDGFLHFIFMYIILKIVKIYLLLILILHPNCKEGYIHNKSQRLGKYRDDPQPPPPSGFS